MSIEIRETVEGGLRVTTFYYRESEKIADIFPLCRFCDTGNSRASRIEMVDALIRNLETGLREKIAQRVERGSKPKHDTHVIPYCPNCHANDVRDEIAKEIRGRK